MVCCQVVQLYGRVAGARRVDKGAVERLTWCGPNKAEAYTIQCKPSLIYTEYERVENTVNDAPLARQGNIFQEA